MNKKQMIALCGYARTGKDTLCKLLINEFDSRGITAQRLALADAIKNDMENFLIEKTQISPWTENLEDKTLIRPLLVEYGRLHRTRSRGTYFTGILTPLVEQCIKNEIVPIITDIRYSPDYSGFEHDEVYWAKESNNGCLVYIKKYTIDNNGDKIYVGAPNKDEEMNNEFLIKAADFIVDWEHDVTLSSSKTKENAVQNEESHFPNFFCTISP